MTLIAFFYSIVASQGFLVTLFLSLKKNKAFHLPLIVFLFLSSTEFTFQFLHVSGIIRNYPVLIYSNEPFTVLKGALIFLYIRNNYHGKVMYYKTDWLFLLPFVVYVYYYSCYYLLSDAQKIEEYNTFLHEGIGMTENLLEWTFEIVVTIPFIVAAIFLLKKTEIKVKNEFSNVANFNYAIARKLLLGVMVVYLFEITTIVMCYFGFENCELFNTIGYGVAAILLYLLGYDALIREQNQMLQMPTLQNEQVLDFEVQEKVLPSQEKYKKNILTAQQIVLIGQKLTQAMEVEKLYRNPDIRLTTLAETLGENPNNVSQVINQLFGQNFYDFINTARIKEAKILLKSSLYDHLTVEAIGQEVGFRSKSTFYASFKKLTSLTPVDYKKA